MEFTQYMANLQHNSNIADNWLNEAGWENL